MFALLLIPAPASAATSEDANDAAGPLDLASLRLTQEERSVELRLRIHSSLPSLGELTAFPSRVEAGNERYLCLQLKGRATDRRLLCPAGEGPKRKLMLGLSSYGEAGAATRRRTIAARLTRLREHSMTVSFSLGKAGFTKGRFAWRGLSGWTGEHCEQPNRPRLARRAERRGVPILDPPEKQENLCLDRAPDARFVKARFHPVRRVGCTRDEDLANTHGSRGTKQVALTFDDGPSTYTDSVLRILDQHKAKGSFYVVGDELSGDTKTLRRAVRRGHELANHSMHHERYPSSSSMKATSARLEAATGFSPCTFRPPYGLMNGDVASAARAIGMSSILWDVDTMDWTLPGSGTIYRRAINDARAGSIVLMHDGGGPRGQTISALPRIIQTLQSRGFKLVTVTEILGEKFLWKEMHR